MANPGFTLAEDAALKSRLKGITISDDRAGTTRDVQTFFRMPEADTEKYYPFITIELMDIAFDPYRAMSEMTYYYVPDVLGASVGDVNTIDYFPSESTSADLAASVSNGLYGFTEQVVPVNLTYQVTTNCRSQAHDRQLTMLLLRRIFPMRRGFIEIPEDGTIRRLDLLDWRQQDILDQEAGYKKRTFRKVYTVQMNAEIPQSDFETVQRVLSIYGTLSGYDTELPSTTASITEDFA